MLSQLATQHRMKDMRRRMVEHDFFSMPAVDHEVNFIVYLHASLFNSAAMRGELWRGMLRVENFDHVAARCRYRAAVADLAARLAIERGFRRQQVDFFAF